ncbi:MAG: EAL domain-containing protein [Rhizobiaceae bacterium]|nr:EAL domain-containing protein [Rhizobiaceae bacterium]
MALAAALQQLDGATWVAIGSLALAGLMLAVALRYRALSTRHAQELANTAELIENLSEGIYRSSPDGLQLSANRALVKLNGYDSEAEMLAGVTDIGKQWYVEAGRREEFRTILHRDGKVENFISEVYRHKTRERIWITESARLVRRRRSHQPLYYEGSVREITGALERLNLEERFHKLTDMLPIGLFQFVRHPDGRFEVACLTGSASRISGIPVAEQIANPRVFNDLVVEEDREMFARSFAASAETVSPWDCEARIVARDGVRKWIRINAHAEMFEGSICWYGYIADISLRKEQELEIRQLAFVDPLTKLLNRRAFMSRMEEIIANCRRRGAHAALLFIDLDNFKTLNDTQGHDMGDLLLEQVAVRLRACVVATDIVARLGGDEFVVVVEEAGGDAAQATLRAISIANRIVSEMNREFALGDLKHAGSASVGLVMVDGAVQSPDDLLKRADAAMYQAKAAGRNGVAIFEPGALDQEAERRQVAADLREALSGDQLVLHFQPQVDFAGRVVGAEALVRWHHPRRGLIAPAQFVALASQFGLGDALARHVLDRGLRTLAGWSREPAMCHLRLALNVTTQCFAADGFVRTLTDLIDHHGVDAGLVTLELTEHVMTREPKRIARRMSELKQLGLRLALDDFGTGQSSLAYLKQLPFDEIKIDGGFVADIEGTDSDRALVKTMLSMASTLGLRSVAEHVENVRQEAFLRAYGCDVLQGNFYCQPLPADEFGALFGPADAPRRTAFRAASA